MKMRAGMAFEILNRSAHSPGNLMLKSIAAYFDADWERPIVTYNTSATPGELTMKAA